MERGERGENIELIVLIMNTITIRIAIAMTIRIQSNKEGIEGKQHGFLQKTKFDRD